MKNVNLGRTTAVTVEQYCDEDIIIHKHDDGRYYCVFVIATSAGFWSNGRHFSRSDEAIIHATKRLEDQIDEYNKKRLQLEIDASIFYMNVHLNVRLNKFNDKVITKFISFRSECYWWRRNIKEAIEGNLFPVNYPDHRYSVPVPRSEGNTIYL